jgi:hypothetical protein
MGISVIKSAHALLKEIAKMRIPEDITALFRGQGERGNLIPGIARQDPLVDTSGKERKMLSDLRRRTALYPELPSMDDWDLLVIKDRVSKTGCQALKLDRSDSDEVSSIKKLALLFSTVQSGFHFRKVRTQSINKV